MNHEAYEIVAEPGDVIIIVFESIILVSLEVWIIVVSEFAIDLFGKQKDN
jgi:hypothetical protein